MGQMKRHALALLLTVPSIFVGGRGGFVWYELEQRETSSISST